jgi:hypothetical protein
MNLASDTWERISYRVVVGDMGAKLCDCWRDSIIYEGQMGKQRSSGAKNLNGEKMCIDSTVILKLTATIGEKCPICDSSMCDVSLENHGKRFVARCTCGFGVGRGASEAVAIGALVNFLRGKNGL